MGYFNVKLKPKRGEIFWIKRSAYKDNDLDIQQKERPGIIVSTDEINEKSLTYEVVYLTTSPKSDEKTHCTIRSSAQVSTALCEKVTTVSGEQLGTCLGKCTSIEMAAIDSCLMISLGLEPKTGTRTAGQSNCKPDVPHYLPTAITAKDAPSVNFSNLPMGPTKKDIENQIKEDMEKDEMMRLRIELGKAQGKADLLKTMYSELLMKYMDAKAGKSD